ncbi:MAG: FxSxx-COOH system tetratricopeptide repeat protein [Fibromonadales bacterium]|nr:FxSxx-COOH system tetratricopeptide repeat protein [Fibromonadales bacterium]
MKKNEDKRDFFISYNKADKQWAKWIAAVLKQNGYSSYIQAWDFRPGDNFVLDMHNALTQSERFIAVLSKDYLTSLYCQAEWASAFSKDPSGEKRLFIPVKISDAEPEGLLAGIIYINLFDAEENVAEKRLLNGVDIKDIPRNRPSYPGTLKVRFPGSLPFHNLPFIRNIYFTGRDSIFKDICSGFEGGNAILLTQVITGMGGLGKTQVALEYAYRYACKYDCIWWVQAETEATVLMAYKDFAVRTKLLNSEQQDSELIIETVLNWMDSHSKWLFIYDNADSITGDTTWLPRNNRENILITTRDRLHYIGRIVNIDIFEEEEAIAFLEKRTEIKDSLNASKLSARLGHFPLALEQAAAYIKIHAITYIEYLSLLEDCGFRVLEKVDGVVNYKDSIAVTLEISFKKIEQEASLQLLYLCSYMAPEDIDEVLFSENSEILPSPLKKMMADRLKRNDIYSQLTRYSLLKKQEDGKGYSMHRLLQEIVRNKIGNDLQWAQYCLSLFRKSYNFEYGNIESHNCFSRLTPHVEAFLDITKTTLITHEDQERIAYLYHMGGFGNYYLGNYNCALEWYYYALTIREKFLGKEHPDTASTYNNMAGIFQDQGNYVKALEYYGHALVVSEKVLGKEHINTVSTYNNIAGVFQSQGNYIKALEYCNYALAIREKVLGKEHKSTANTYNNIGGIFENQGDYVKALEFYGHALAIREKVLGKEHPNTANTYNNIAIIFRAQSDYSKALEYHNYALAIREKVLGKEHSDTANTYNNIAMILQYQGDYNKALEYYDYALAILEKVLGKEHKNTAGIYNNMAEIFRTQGNYAKALEYYGYALTIYEKVLGKEHPNTATTYNNIAVVFYDQNNYTKALEWHIRSYRIFSNKLGAEHQNTKKILKNIVQAYRLSCNAMDFEKWLEEQTALGLE